MSLNQVQLIGNLGANPEVVSLASGNKTSFSVATNERYTDKNGNPKTDTEWHNIVCWGNLADITAKYLKKGSQVFVQGKIKTRSYDDQNGQKRYITEIIASSVQFLDAKPQDTQQTQQAMPQAQMPMNNGYPQQMPQAQAPQAQMPMNNGYPQQMPQAQAPQAQMPMNNGYPQQAPMNNGYPQQMPMNNGYQQQAPQQMPQAQMPTPSNIDNDIPF